MHLLALDEFGHERPTDPNQCPVFGYGGFCIKLEDIDDLVLNFNKLKAIAFRNVMLSKVESYLKATDQGLESPSVAKQVRSRFLSGLSDEELRKFADRIRRAPADGLLKDHELSKAIHKYEVKGEDVFSVSYINKINIQVANNHPGAEKKRKRFVFFIKSFIQCLKSTDSRVFYYGFHRSGFPHIAANKRIHVELIKDVLSAANRFGKRKNTKTIVLFDHHHTDEMRLRNDDRDAKKTRSDRASEIFANSDTALRVPEPILNAKSHLSTSVQIADWICSILKIYWLSRADGREEFKYIRDAIGKEFLSIWLDEATFKMGRETVTGAIKQEQLALNFRS